jgi:uncharacterized protein (TIGR03067 family)
MTFVLVAGCDSADDKAIPDIQKLQGTWVGTELGREGEVTLTFSGNSIDFKGASDQEWYKGLAVLNEELTPKQADFTIEECPAPNYVGKIAKAIYKLEDGVLTLAGSEPGSETRPVSFDADPSGEVRVFEFTLQASNKE